MQLSRKNDPFSSLSGLHSQLDDMFNSFFTNMPSTQNLPAMNAYVEDDKRLVAEIEAPGFDQNDVEVSVHNGVLEIKGQKHEKEEEKNKKRSYMVRESSASFYRSIALPKHADADNVEADFDKGLLRVVVPFKELPSPKKITIKSGGKQ